MKRTIRHLSSAFKRSVLRRRLNRIRYVGWSRYCPICGSYVRKFLRFGVVARPDAQCPVCHSLERHRLVWKFFTAQTDLFEPERKRVLHVAPEGAFSRIFEKQKHIDYLTADLYDSDVMVKMDITDVQYPDGAFDVIYCSHVLEHVPEDQKAMRELHRVLASGGWAVLQVPITVEETFEDPSVTDPKERERLFGQRDHVRRYGPDFEIRLAEAGFEVRTYKAAEVVGAENIERMGIMEDKKVYYCTKVGGA